MGLDWSLDAVQVLRLIGLTYLTLIWSVWSVLKGENTFSVIWLKKKKKKKRGGKGVETCYVGSHADIYCPVFFQTCYGDRHCIVWHQFEWALLSFKVTVIWEQRNLVLIIL